MFSHLPPCPRMYILSPSKPSTSPQLYQNLVCSRLLVTNLRIEDQQWRWPEEIGIAQNILPESPANNFDRWRTPLANPAEHSNLPSYGTFKSPSEPFYTSRGIGRPSWIFMHNQQCTKRSSARFSYLCAYSKTLGSDGLAGWDGLLQGSESRLSPVARKFICIGKLSEEWKSIVRSLSETYMSPLSIGLSVRVHPDVKRSPAEMA